MDVPNIKEVHSKPRLHVSVNLFIWSLATMLHDSVIMVVTTAAVLMRPQAIPLAMITIRKSTHGFPSLSYMSMAGAPHGAGGPL